MNSYKWNAKEYSQFSSEQEKWARTTIEKLKLNKGENVLDVGCGDARVTAEIAKQVYLGSVIGVDSSQSMVDLAGKRFSGSNYSNLSFMCVDARKLNFGNQFDVVTSNAVLHWIDDHISVLKGIYKALKPGGRVILQMGGKGNAAEIISVAEEVLNKHDWKKYFNEFKFPYYFFSVVEYEKFISQSGFSSAKIELIDKDMQHNGEEKLAGWIRTTWLPYTQRVPENLREDFIKEIIDNYIKKYPPDNDGIIHVGMKRFIVETTK